MEKVTALGGRGFVGSEDIFFPQATHVVRFNIGIYLFQNRLLLLAQFYLRQWQPE